MKAKTLLATALTLASAFLLVPSPAQAAHIGAMEVTQRAAGPLYEVTIRVELEITGGCCGGAFTWDTGDGAVGTVADGVVGAAYAGDASGLGTMVGGGRPFTWQRSGPDPIVIDITYAYQIPGVYQVTWNDCCDAAGATVSGELTVVTLFNTFYTEDFDDGTADGWTMNGLWRVTGCQSFDDPNSLGYNQGLCPPNFNTGFATAGTATSPPIAVPLAVGAQLSWESWHDTESGTFFDSKIVEVSTDGIAWTMVWQESGPQQVWNHRCVSLNLVNTPDVIWVRFRFDSIDSILNNGQGWYVDDVRVHNHLPSC